MDGPRGYNAKWNKSDRERQIQKWFHLYVESKQQMSYVNDISLKLEKNRPLSATARLKPRLPAPELHTKPLRVSAIKQTNHIHLSFSLVTFRLFAVFLTMNKFQWTSLCLSPFACIRWMFPEAIYIKRSSYGILFCFLKEQSRCCLKVSSFQKNVFLW